jgi:RHS repeat-associated protein
MRTEKSLTLNPVPIKMKKLLIALFVLLGYQSVIAQHNPFVEYGYTPKIATLSQGQFNEFHDQDTIVQIGSVLFNTRSRQIVAFVETDTLYSESDLQPDIVSRWISPDPLADHPNQAGRSPYEYAWSNPVYWTDPDGRCPLCPWLDAIVDVGFMLYDVGEMVYDYSTKGSVNPVSVAALSADAASIFVPMTVGAGLAVRGSAKAVNAVDNAIDASKVVSKSNDTQKTLNKVDNVAKQGDGIIYKRTDKTGNQKDYIGQAKSEDRYKARQKEHQRANKDADYDFTEIGRGTQGKDLNMKEQKHIDAGGGPTNKSNPDGGLSNKRNVIKKY